MLRITKARFACKKTARRNLSITDPHTGATLSRVQPDSKQSISTKFAQAKQGKLELAELPLIKKIEILFRFNELLAKNSENLASILTSETGKPISQSLNEIKATPNRIRFMTQHVHEVLSPKIVFKNNQMEEVITREPLGVIANISAWNYPFFVGINVIAPALLTGNSVLYKPSEYSTLTGLQIVDLLHQAGFPTNSIIPVIGDGKVGNELLNQPINGVFFTGSFKTGALISELAGKKMIKAQLELGGKDPIYVHEDVSVKDVAEATADGAFYNCGQSCCSVERIYVHEKIYYEFVKHFVAFVQTFKIGNPKDSDTYIGPLARPQHVNFLKEQVLDAVSKGAKLLTGGDVVTPSPSTASFNAYFQPTVLIDVNHKMNIMQEESFGPVIGIQKVSGSAEAITLMNESNYGLTAGVYSKSPSVANEILEKVESGTVYWNCCDRVSPNLPWSGRKNSGIGLTLSAEGISTFTVPKAWHKKTV